tara:strand:+ start:351 stop:1397 length:1047 start_codon:yes stop_codon:yes gene_type:complete
MQHLIKLIKNKKSHKTIYYIKQVVWSYLAPRSFKLNYKKKLYKLLNDETSKIFFDRVNYYNKMSNSFSLPDEDVYNKNISKEKNKDSIIILAKNIFKINCSSAYKYDCNRYLSCFNKNFLTACSMGDVTQIPKLPSIIKSRPIKDRKQNQNSIILKLDRVRHFKFIQDKTPYKDKINKLVWRGKIQKKQPHRIRFLQKIYGNHLCNVAQTNKKQEHAYGNYLSIQEQLKYKFILCIEGNDVATNLKWAMSSNSLCFMTKPKYETWFMEGTLKPGIHYVELKDDYSDLEEKINYYSQNTEEAQYIIQNAHSHVEIFKNKTHENLISLLVLEKYFNLSGQIKSEYQYLFK